MDGLVKDRTQCSPNGYYFIPVYDKVIFRSNDNVDINIILMKGWNGTLLFLWPIVLAIVLLDGFIFIPQASSDTRRISKVYIYFKFYQGYQTK